MNKIILIFLLLVSSVSHAQLEWFLLGSLLTEKSSRTTVIRDEFSENVSQIRSKIPFSDSQFSPKQNYSFKVSNPQKIANFFKNEGYLVSLEKNEVFFNFEKQYINNLEQSKRIKANMDVFLGYAKTGSLIIFSIIFLIGFIVGIKDSFLIIEDMGLFKILPNNSKLRKFMENREKESKKRMLENWHIIYPNGKTKSLASANKENSCKIK